MTASLSKRSVNTVILVVLGLTAAAVAETAKLELKRLSEQSGFRQGADQLFRMVSSQSFGMDREEGDRAKQRNEEFAGVIKKQPDKYQCEFPFRGVAKLGSQKFGWALDSTKPPRGYNRLLFDLNGNGDLTDDKPVEALKDRGVYFSSDYARCEFPRVDLAIDVEGRKLEYAFFFSVYSQGLEASKAPRYASASLDAAVYRDGQITLDGKQHRVVLLDYNSTGRFNDRFEVNGDIVSNDGQIYPNYGDMLLVDPDTRRTDYPGYGLTDRKERIPISKVACIGEKYYELKISAAGDEVTLTPYKGTLAPAVNANVDRYDAVVYGDQGLIKISGERNKPVMLPVGEWRVLSYRAEAAPPREATSKPATQPTQAAQVTQTDKTDAATKPADEKKKKPKTALAKAIRSWLGTADDEGDDEAQEEESSFLPQRRATLVSANGTKDAVPFKVEEGRTSFMKFGPPYKPTVRPSYWRDEREVQLALAIVGSGAEVLSDLQVNGDRPKAPTFQIVSPSGEIILRGKFEFG